MVWDRHTGRPIYNAISWQDTRTDKIVDSLPRRGARTASGLKTGLPLTTYFSGPKIQWILDHVEGARDGAEKGDVLFGTMDTWLIWKLTGRHVTDVTNASRTMLMDLRTLEWDDELLEAMKVPRAMLPEIHASSEPYGEAGAALGGLPVAAALGDQQAALFGQTCFSAGEAKCTYGTGSFLLLNTGERVVQSTHGLLTTVGCRIAGEPATYALEGSIAVTGALVQWLRDKLGMISSAAEIETLPGPWTTAAASTSVPAFSGLSPPTGALTPVA